MEIERKFLVNALPDLSNIPYKQIAQAYISISPVIRVRQMGDTYYLTVKSKGHLMREEFELEITKTEYMNLYAKVEGIAIEKTRYFISLEDGLIAELDFYKGALDGLITVEVEFDTEAAAKHFTPPNWFGKDVTEDVRFKNNYLSAHGLVNHLLE